MINIQTKWIVIGVFILLLVLGAFGYIGYSLYHSSVVAKSETKLSNNQTGAAIANGKDAINTVDKRTEVVTHIDHMVRDITDVIHSNPKSTEEMDLNLYDSGINGLCGYDTYSGNSVCLQ